jgi:hypothetical protein
MEHTTKRTALRATWVVQGLAIAALCGGAGVASASPILHAHIGHQDRLGTFAITNFVVTDDDGSGQDGGENLQQWTPSDNVQDLAVSTSDCDPATVPEPGTLALLFAGVAGMVLIGKRRGAAGSSTSAMHR